MPRIPVRDVLLNAPGVTRDVPFSAEQFGAGRARVLQARAQATQQVGKAAVRAVNVVQKHQERQDLNKLNVSISQFQAETASALDQEHKLGTLNSLKFMAEFRERAKKLQDSADSSGGTDFVIRNLARIELQVAQKSALLQADIDGKNAILSHDKGVANRSAGISLEGFQETVNENNIFNDTFSGTLDSTQINELKFQDSITLAQAAVRNAINLRASAGADALQRIKDPNNPKQTISDPTKPWQAFIDGALQKQLLAEVRTKATHERVAARDAELKAARARKLAIENRFTDMVDNFDALDVDIVREDEALDGPSKIRMINLIDKRDSGDDPEVFNELLGKILSGQITDEKELDFSLGQGLSFESFKALRAEIQGKGTIQGKIDAENKRTFMQSAKKQIVMSVPLKGIKDPKGETMYREFSFMINNKIEAQRKAGKPISNLFDKRHVDSLEPDILRFQRSLSEITADMSAALKPSSDAIRSKAFLEAKKKLAEQVELFDEPDKPLTPEESQKRNEKVRRLQEEFRQKARGLGVKADKIQSIITPAGKTAEELFLDDLDSQKEKLNTPRLTNPDGTKEDPAVWLERINRQQRERK